MLCPACKSERFHRRHRTFSERLRYAAIYECRVCHCRDVEFYHEHYPFFSRVARCPDCGNAILRVQNVVDPIERMYRNPLSYLQKHLRAPLLYCSPCRLQFYDLRPLEKAVPVNAAAGAASTPGRAKPPSNAA